MPFAGRGRVQSLLGCVCRMPLSVSKLAEQLASTLAEQLAYVLPVSAGFGAVAVVAEAAFFPPRFVLVDFFARLACCVLR